MKSCPPSTLFSRSNRLHGSSMVSQTINKFQKFLHHGYVEFFSRLQSRGCFSSFVHNSRFSLSGPFSCYCLFDLSHFSTKTTIHKRASQTGKKDQLSVWHGLEWHDGRSQSCARRKWWRGFDFMKLDFIHFGLSLWIPIQFIVSSSSVERSLKNQHSVSLRLDRNWLIAFSLVMLGCILFLRQLKLCSHSTDVGIIDKTFDAVFQSNGYLSLCIIVNTSINVKNSFLSKTVPFCCDMFLAKTISSVFSMISRAINDTSQNFSLKKNGLISRLRIKSSGKRKRPTISCKGLFVQLPSRKRGWFDKVFGQRVVLPLSCLLKDLGMGIVPPCWAEKRRWFRGKMAIVHWSKPPESQKMKM